MPIGDPLAYLLPGAQNMGIPGQMPSAPPSVLSQVGGTPFNPAALPSTPPGVAPAAEVPFMERLQTDQALQQALMMFGAGLTQPIQPNDSLGGVFGRSVADSINFYNQRQAQIAAGERAERAESREDRQLDQSDRRIDQQGEQLDLSRDQLDLSQSQLDQQGAHFEAQAGLRAAKEALATAQAGYYDRMPTGSKGSGSAQTAKVDALALAMYNAEVTAIKNGTLQGAPKYTANKDLAYIDAASLVEGHSPNNDLLIRAMPAIAEALPFMDEEDRKAVGEFLAEAGTNIASGNVADSGRYLTGDNAQVPTVASTQQPATPAAPVTPPNPVATPNDVSTGTDAAAAVPVAAATSMPPGVPQVPLAATPQAATQSAAQQQQQQAQEQARMAINIQNAQRANVVPLEDTPPPPDNSPQVGETRERGGVIYVWGFNHQHSAWGWTPMTLGLNIPGVGQ